MNFVVHSCFATKIHS